MVAAARAEAREDLRDLRREVHELATSVLKRSESARPAPLKEQGDKECIVPRVFK
jgi:hypothetical protein